MKSGTLTLQLSFLRPTADVETDGDDSDDLALQSTPSPQTDGDDSDDLAQQLTPPPVPAEDNTQANHPFSRATMQVILPLIQSLMETVSHAEVKLGGD